jgi:hypothetical protein
MTPSSTSTLPKVSDSNTCHAEGASWALRIDGVAQLDLPLLQWNTTVYLVQLAVLVILVLLWGLGLWVWVTGSGSLDPGL